MVRLSMMYRAFIGLLACMLFSLPAGPAAAGGRAREVLDRAKQLDDTVRHWTDRVEHMVLHIYGRRGGERVRELVIYRKRYGGGEEKAVSFFLSPAEVHGTAFLAFSHPHRADDQWLYLPALKRIRRITARGKDQSFMGTDFTYRDLDILNEMRDWKEKDAPSRLLREDSVGGVAAYVIELRPRREDIPYGRIVMWMGKDDLVARKLELYGRDSGELEKVLSREDVRKIGAIPTPHHLEMRNLKRGSRTVVELSEVRYDQGLADDLFTQRQLERGVP